MWAGNRYCGGSKEDRPFDREGRKLLEVISSLGIGTGYQPHERERSLTALDLFDGVVFASHCEWHDDP